MTEPRTHRPDDIPPELWKASTEAQFEELRIRMHELAHAIIAETPRFLRPLVRRLLGHGKR